MTDPEKDDNKSPGGMPSDWRKPTKERFKSRAWNPQDRRLFTPKTFGYGYGINFYWLLHPVQCLRRG
jgi:hypothetical protein